MTQTIAYLGPPGTYGEAAALAWSDWWATHHGENSQRCPYPSIFQTLKALASGETDLAIAPVENSIQGSVTMTMDALWQMDRLQIQKALVLPISHAFISHAQSFSQIREVYSHPQALAQCQEWLERNVPNAQLIPTNSTTESLQHIDEAGTMAAIASRRAADLYQLPVLAHPINDRPDNCTRFWVLSRQPSPGGTHTSLAFDLPSNSPGALLKALQILADRNINMSRIESRPTKRSLGEYLFFIDFEADSHSTSAQTALEELKNCTETLKIFGSYSVLEV
ncbi:MAG: prephenate dehydratase [Synechococcales cyanobacterium T60_A2020_003]|nr:prephenate dehydratase [Synechococcales cyanobacterium T60_A2020_003]